MEQQTDCLDPLGDSPSTILDRNRVDSSQDSNLQACCLSFLKQKFVLSLLSGDEAVAMAAMTPG